ncbi:HAD family hydrolase [Nonomuraea sp. NPDC059023]|uniref:HAD family hydrolase n=1 Tax=unclassified Nonomuraea TaxID=2593643 RepID=UPI0036853FEF
MQRLALFDLDNTLIDRDLAFRAWAEEFAGTRGLGADGVEVLVGLDRESRPRRDVFFGLVRDRFGLAEPVETLWTGYRRRMPYLVTCRPEVLNGLAALRESGWKLGIVTNGMADNQLGKIRRTGLADAVDGYAVSGAENIRKPDRRLFEIAADRCGASPADGGWMVGDNLVADIGGGRGAGLRTIWVDHGNRPDAGHGADHVVGDVTDAFRILSLA